MIGCSVINGKSVSDGLAELIIDLPGVFREGKGQRWAIVLAGGDGRRMCEAIRQWIGESLPKQFCNFLADKTMLESTWQRARKLVDEKNIVTLANIEHQHYFSRYDLGIIPGRLLYQPGNFGTAPAIYFALAHILARDPDARIIILPSDHFIYPEDRFVSLASQVFEFVKQHADQPVLFGAEALDANMDYGWMDVETENKGEGLDENHPDFMRISGFYERPAAEVVRQLHNRHALCSTMIMVASAPRLWQIGQAYSPALLERMGYVRMAMQRYPQSGEPCDYLFSAISHAYYHLPVIDFSREIIQPAGHEYLATCMKDIEWDDWGRPERIMNTAQRHGFPCPQLC